MLTVVRRGTPPSLEKPSDIVRGEAARLAWAWDGLVFGVPLNEAGNEGLRDIVNNTPPWVISEAFWARDNRGNPVLRFTDPGTAPYAEWPTASPVHDSPSTALTAYVRLQRLGTPNGDGGAFTNPYGFSSPWETWSINAATADATKLYGAIGVGGTQYTTGESVSVPNTEQISIFLRWRSGEAPQMNVLGERGNSIGSLIGATTATGSLQYAAGFGIRLNCHEANTANYYGYYSQAMVWKRRLTDIEMTSLVADPFGWYAPRRETTTVAGSYALAFGAGEVRHGTSGGGLR
jgi:hypothetical protein